MQEQPESALAPGLTARVELTVTDADTAQAVGSGDVPVLGTPRVLALAEAATVAADRHRGCPAGRRPSAPGSSSTIARHRGGADGGGAGAAGRRSRGGGCTSR